MEEAVSLDCNSLIDLLDPQALADVRVVHAFDRDIAETLAWIQEKDTAVSSEDYGHDLPSVQALVRRHTGFEVNKV